MRCFEDTEVIHVSGKIDPLDDIEIINLELNLADLSQLQKRRERIKKQVKTSKEAAQEDSLLEKIEDELQKGLSVRSISLSDEENLMIKQFGFSHCKNQLFMRLI